MLKINHLRSGFAKYRMELTHSQTKVVSFIFSCIYKKTFKTLRAIDDS